MQQIALKDAQNRLGELLGLVTLGKEIIIKKDDGSTFKILPVAQKKSTPKFGSAKGLIEISDNFDDFLEDFKDYMP